MAVNILMFPDAVVHSCSVKMFSSTFCKLHGKPAVSESLFDKIAGLKPLARNFIKEETAALVFSSEFCKIFENTYFDDYS